MVSHFIQESGVTGGWLAVAALGTAVVAYFLGCFNGAVVVSRYLLRDDVRAHGSGNAGLTNFYRSFGGPLTAVVILSDVVKALVAVALSGWLCGLLSPALVPVGKYWAGMFCLLGHMYPCTFQFRGGKGILSGGAIVFLLDWRVALVVWGGFLILAIATRYVSLGSCWAGLSFPFVSGVVYQDTFITLMAVIIGALILWKHRGNMKRLVLGTESKFALRKKEKAPEEPEEPDPFEALAEELAAERSTQAETPDEPLEAADQAAEPDAIQPQTEDGGAEVPQPSTPKRRRSSRRKS